MSGIAAGYGQPDPTDMRNMFTKIDHRGPYLSGIRREAKVMMGQNYLRADVPGAETGTPVPLIGKGEDNGKLMICYDGQIGNPAELARRFGVEPGPFLEERLLLRMYKEQGAGMLDHLSDAIFSLVISDGSDFFAARDLLGIKTLFYTRKNNTLYLASELKGITAISGGVSEFPEGHYMDGSGRLTRYAQLPADPPEIMSKDMDTAAAEIREMIERSIRTRVDFSRPTAGLLSGGMDSSVICTLSSQLYREKFGKEVQLKTFAIGVGESEDIRCARIMAEHIGSRHHELIVELPQVLDALPEVIYYLENFDPSLVRSSVSNFLVSGYAKEQGIEVLLSGEGGDEVFCGYIYLKNFPARELVMKQVECLKFLHNNASLRLDRMNQCHSIRVVAPLISGELLDYALKLPPEFKQRKQGDQKVEKWIFRKAYESLLPEAVAGRIKQEFSQGSGSAAVLPQYFEKAVNDEEFREAQAEHPLIRSKEEFYYFNIFAKHFGTGAAVKTVGQWLSL
jgi:asparagine synthase (glutamine-hydrolysing)